MDQLISNDSACKPLFLIDVSPSLNCHHGLESKPPTFAEPMMDGKSLPKAPAFVESVADAEIAFPAGKKGFKLRITFKAFGHVAHH
ncbi:hypothetical protein AGR4C_Cc50381 [Agrobacterium tumefaciens str. Kerr 14]|uniref:Uncharacterized protein n=1 Tax=Agrobacterium tumefaciens str. Kerr 14 TaxID=1183424 RepID=A0A1S7Q3M2_AGRTU|nr:hypothetical protein AGR4C_Cc50381 [Agrobacterium tumefaciens str. Kerr 14]